MLYQGQETYPWPGKAAMKDEPAFHRIASLSMFDGQQGGSSDRPGPYETPALQSWEKVPIDSEYKLNR